MRTGSFLNLPWAGRRMQALIPFFLSNHTAHPFATEDPNMWEVVIVVYSPETLSLQQIASLPEHWKHTTTL